MAEQHDERIIRLENLTSFLVQNIQNQEETNRKLAENNNRLDNLIEKQIGLSVEIKEMMTIMEARVTQNENRITLVEERMAENEERMDASMKRMEKNEERMEKNEKRLDDTISRMDKTMDRLDRTLTRMLERNNNGHNGHAN